MNKKCSICGGEVNEKSAVLTMTGAGNARLICEGCEAKLNTALRSKDYQEIAEACDGLAELMEKSECEDEVTLETMREIYAEAKDRAEKIKTGEYDFTLDADEEDTLPEDIPEELLELEEDRLLDEKEALANKKADGIITAVSAVIFIAALIFFIVKSFF